MSKVNGMGMRANGLQDNYVASPYTTPKVHMQPEAISTGLNIRMNERPKSKWTDASHTQQQNIPGQPIQQTVPVQPIQQNIPVQPIQQSIPVQPISGQPIQQNIPLQQQQQQQMMQQQYLQQPNVIEHNIQLPPEQLIPAQDKERSQLRVGNGLAPSEKRQARPFNAETSMSAQAGKQSFYWPFDKAQEQLVNARPRVLKPYLPGTALEHVIMNEPYHSQQQQAGAQQAPMFTQAMSEEELLSAANSQAQQLLMQQQQMKAQQQAAELAAAQQADMVAQQQLNAQQQQVQLSAQQQQQAQLAAQQEAQLAAQQQQLAPLAQLPVQNPADQLLPQPSMSAQEAIPLTALPINSQQPPQNYGHNYQQMYPNQTLPHQQVQISAQAKYAEPLPVSAHGMPPGAVETGVMGDSSSSRNFAEHNSVVG